MMMRKGPIRLGIVIYAAYLVIIAWSAYGAISVVMESNKVEQAKIDTCLAGRTDLGAAVECNGIRWDGQDDPSHKPLPFVPYLLAAIAPPILLVLGFLAFRWVRAGFEADPSN